MKAAKKVELLAPAGNAEAFYGAIHAGAVLYIWVAAVSGPELMRKIFRKKNWLPASGMLIFFAKSISDGKHTG